jgi:hypothetical protein
LNLTLMKVSPPFVLGFTVLAFLLLLHPLAARSFRLAPSFIPNGGAFSCNTCHGSSKSIKNAFGLDVNSLVSRNGRQKFWDAVLAAEDSDEDGFSNGLELGDENGDGVLERTTNLSNPGDASSVPDFPNTAPSFTSSPVTSAEVGIPYVYQVAAVDPENNSLAFSKVSGPDWLSVSSTGLVSGTPVSVAAASVSIQVRVTDNGNPAKSTDQSYNLQVRVSFTGWQALYFDPDVEPSLKAAGADPDNDGVPNLLEYALLGNPMENEPSILQRLALLDMSSPGAAFNAEGKLTFFLDVRDDDPALTIVVLADTSLGFDSSTVVQAVVSDPVIDDGLQRLTFVDPEVASSAKARFFRIQVSRDL